MLIQTAERALLHRLRFKVGLDTWLWEMPSKTTLTPVERFSALGERVVALADGKPVSVSKRGVLYAAKFVLDLEAGKVGFSVSAHSVVTSSEDNSGLTLHGVAAEWKFDEADSPTKEGVYASSLEGEENLAKMQALESTVNIAEYLKN